MHAAWLDSFQKIFNEYAAETMFFQSQAFPTEKNPKGFQKKPNWQRCCKVGFWSFWPGSVANSSYNNYTEQIYQKIYQI